MKITGSCREGVLTLRFHGELDHHVSREAMEALSERIDAFLPGSCVLDLRDLSFMDSSGIGLVMGRYKLMHAMGGRLRVRGVNRSTMKVMKLAGLDLLAKIDCKGE